MPTINDLVSKKPSCSDFKTEEGYSRILEVWNQKIEPQIKSMMIMVESKPARENFSDQIEFEECYGYWMSRKGRNIGALLSKCLRFWENVEIENKDYWR